MYVFSVNPWAVLVASVISFLIGGFWYSSWAFLPMWMNLTGVTKESQATASRTKRGINYGLIFLGLLLIAFVVGVFLKNLYIPSVSEAVAAGFWLWFGGVAAVQMIGIASLGQPRGSWKLFAINAGYFLIVFLLSAYIIFLMS